MKKSLTIIFLLSFSSNFFAKNNFIPDMHIKKVLPEDTALKEEMRPLCFEHTPKDQTKSNITKTRNIVGRISNFVFWYTKRSKKPDKRIKVLETAKKDFGATLQYITTEDHVQISSLYFKRKEAPINLLLVTGYFEHLTPTKEWAAPFASIFPNFNVLCFDWRGYGSSTGNPKARFGTNAYKDINAAIKFLRKDNDKPVVIAGFCMGGGMCLRAILGAKTKEELPDAVILDSSFSKLANVMYRAANDPDTTLIQRFAIRNSLIRYIRNRKLDGNVLDLRPAELIKQIKIPCLVQHFSKDKLAIISEGIRVFNEASCPKMFLQSDVGKHARIHTVVPFQYRNAVYNFLITFGLLNPL